MQPEYPGREREAQGRGRAARSGAATAAERVNGPLSAQAYWKEMTSIGLSDTIKVSTTKRFLWGILEKVTFEEIIFLLEKQV